MRILCTTYATSNEKQLRNLLLSAAIAGLPIELLGYGQPWVHNFQKFRATIEYLYAAHKRGFTHALSVDAFDVLFLRNRAAIESAYTLAAGSPWLMAAERFAENVPRHTIMDWPETPIENPYRYLNCGMWMGEIEYILATSKRLNLLNHDDTEDDEEILSELFTRNPGVITLDYAQSLFHVLYPDESDCEQTSQGARNRITKEYPCIVHATASLSMATCQSWVGLKPT